MSNFLVPPQTIQSMGFSRPESGSGYLFPSPGDLPNPGIKPRSWTLQADSLPAEPPGKPKRYKSVSQILRGICLYVKKKKKKKTNNILSWNSDLTSMPGFNVGSLNTMSFFNLKRRMLIKKLIKNIYTHTHMHGHIHTYANKGLIDKFANLILLN